MASYVKNKLEFKVKLMQVIYDGNALVKKCSRLIDYYYSLVLDDNNRPISDDAYNELVQMANKAFDMDFEEHNEYDRDATVNHVFEAIENANLSELIELCRIINDSARQISGNKRRY